MALSILEGAKKWTVLLLFVGLTFSCCGCSWFMKRAIGPWGLRDIKGSFDANTKTVYVSFRFLDSVVDILDYRLKGERLDGGTKYRLTLFGQHIGKSTDVKARQNHQIRRIDGRYEVQLKLDSFDITHDQLVYWYRGQEYPIKIGK